MHRTLKEEIKEYSIRNDKNNYKKLLDDSSEKIININFDTELIRLKKQTLEKKDYFNLKSFFKTLIENNIDKNEIIQWCIKLGKYSTVLILYNDSLEYYSKSLEIYKESLPSNHPNIVTSYNDIGNIYHNKGDYDKALEYYTKSLEILK